MEMMLKTKDVSEQLGVNPTTIHRWAKYFGLVCKTNEHGHYLFTQKDVEAMRLVQTQLQDGNRMKDIDIASFSGVPDERPQDQFMINIDLYEQKLEEVMTKVQYLEQKVSQKADEVVSYQLLKHRSELEDMKKLIKGLEGRLTQMEHKIERENHINEDVLKMVAGEGPQRKWRTFMQLFSF